MDEPEPLDGEAVGHGVVARRAERLEVVGKGVDGSGRREWGELRAREEEFRSPVTVVG